MEAVLTTASCACWFGAIYFAVKWIGPFWDAATRPYVNDLIIQMKAVGIEEQMVNQYMRWWTVALIGVLVLGFVFSMKLIALTLAVVVFVAPRFLLQRILDRRRLQLRDQLVGAMVSLSNTVRSGLSLGQGLAAVTEDAPQPLKTELGRICYQLRFGMPLAKAIEEARKKLQLDSFTLFAAAATVNLQRGGNLTETLERISASLQENQRLERKLEADTQAGKKVVTILAVFPLGFLGLFYLLEPDGTGLLFTTLPGNVVLILIGVLIYVAVKWAMKILKIDI